MSAGEQSAEGGPRDSAGAESPHESSETSEPGTTKEEQVRAPAGGTPQEPFSEEGYEEFIEPEPPRRKARRPVPFGSIVLTLAILVVLVAWTLASPAVMPEVGETYVRSPTYAAWGSYTGYRSIWAGNTTWGVAISAGSATQGNWELDLRVLLTKVEERPGNWFLRGTAVSLRNVSVFASDGTWLGSMSDSTDLGFGVLATVHISFPSNGTYQLFISMKFLVYEVMRIGFIPLEMIRIPQVYLDRPVVVG